MTRNVQKAQLQTTRPHPLARALLPTALATMLDINDFEAVFASDLTGGDIYPHATVNTIRANRRTLGGTLFFDRLLAQLHVKSN